MDHIGIAILIWIVTSILIVATFESEFSKYRKSKQSLLLDIHSKKEELIKERDHIADTRRKNLAEIEETRQQFEQWRQWQIHDIEEANIGIAQMANEKSRGFPWLADAYANYDHLRDLRLADFLEYKSHPAPKAADSVRIIAAKRRKAEKLYRILKYKLEYYETLFPWLTDFTSDDVDDLIIRIMKGKQDDSENEENTDPAKKWLTDAEYQKLPIVEKFQIALDRYWQKKKTPWEIGRDYERYIGYLYENDGYNVYYQGIVKGLADLGRDLIAMRDDEIEIIQCKYWRKEKVIREKHIFQLFGTAVEYWLKKSKEMSVAQMDLLPQLIEAENFRPTFITSTSLSDEAREFAGVLGVKIRENVPLDKYPSIKCNISKRNGEKIYHLPFDQQYDRVIIEEEKNECYVETVAEAENMGYRRSFRWRGEKIE